MNATKTRYNIQHVRNFASVLVQKDMISRGIAYLHALQSCQDSEIQGMTTVFIRCLLRNCLPHQSQQVVNLLDEHYDYSDRPLDLFLMWGLLTSVEVMYNRVGTPRQQFQARRDWLRFQKRYGVKLDPWLKAEDSVA